MTAIDMTDGRDNNKNNQANDPYLLEKEQLSKYRSVYSRENMDYTRLSPTEYSAKLVKLRIDLLKKCYTSGITLDICCGSGDYSIPLSEQFEYTVGIDFSDRLVKAASERRTREKALNTAFLVGNARSLPLKDNSVSLAFSFSSLYNIPLLNEAVSECSRVLRPGGVAVLEFGALYSLNTLVCRAHKDLAYPCHKPLKEIYSMLKDANLEIESEKCFQILPYWTTRPLYLLPLLLPVWKKIMEKEYNGRMIDERVSEISFLRPFAFRHIIVCRKSGGA